MISGFIILLAGESGSGKTTIARILNEKHNMKSITSYTTRPPRYQQETGHIFVTDKEYETMRDDMVAFTVFDGYKYWATNKQVEEADIYIIDPAGVEYFEQHYKGDKKIITAKLVTSKKTRYRRMRKRGDSVSQAIKRIRHDKKAFKKFYPMLNINVNIDDVEAAVERFLFVTELKKAALTFMDNKRGTENV